MVSQYGSCGAIVRPYVTNRERALVSTFDLRRAARVGKNAWMFMRSRQLPDW